MNREYNRLILNKNRFCKTITSFQANFKTLDMYQAANQLKMSSRMNKRLLNDDKSIARNICWLIATLLWLLSLLRLKKKTIKELDMLSCALFCQCIVLFCSALVHDVVNNLKYEHSWKIKTTIWNRLYDDLLTLGLFDY